ncbi:hypothetical protein L6R34_29145, partial [Escherichia coli]|nr:hypothetical protein [Escherichia coli]
NRNLMKAILSGRAQIAKAVNATVISLDDAPKGYSDFDKGAAKKFVIDPHGTSKYNKKPDVLRTPALLLVIRCFKALSCFVLNN